MLNYPLELKVKQDLQDSLFKMFPPIKNYRLDKKEIILQELKTHTR